VKEEEELNALKADNKNLFTNSTTEFISRVQPIEEILGEKKKLKKG